MPAYSSNFWANPEINLKLLHPIAPNSVFPDAIVILDWIFYCYLQIRFDSNF
jgi:hypothetical protein